MLDDGDALILPGGNPGYLNLRSSEAVCRVVRHYYNSGRLVAAICGAPMVLVASGVGRRLIGVARNEAEGSSHKNTTLFIVSRFFVHYSGSAGRKASDIKTVVVGPLLKPQTTTT